MILVFGGAYQGKTEYASKHLGAGSVCDVAEEGAPDFTKDMITGLEGFVLRSVEQGGDPVEYFASRRSEWEDKILVINDVSQGVVPVDGTLRAAREANGRLMIYLADEAEQVHRVFCGIGKRIK